jgi:hypothetical protein
MKKQELTQEILKELLDYDPLTGIFVWRERPLSMFKSEKDCYIWNKRFANKHAGCIAKVRGKLYKNISILKKTYNLHRLAYFYITGKYTNDDIDCIDNDYTNIMFSNIRLCKRSDTRYKTIKEKGTSGFIGVRLNKNNRYRSEIYLDGKVIHLGMFNTPEEAHEAYCEAKRQISPEFSML